MTPARCSPPPPPRPTRLDPVKLFLDADIVVQVVMAGLLLASVWVWTIIVAFSLRMGGVRRRSRRVRGGVLGGATTSTRCYSERGQGDIPRRGSPPPGSPNGVTRPRADGATATARASGSALAMEGQVATEADTLAERLNFLATIGSVAPFVGLFGTVWGIMNSFFQIGAAAEFLARGGRAGHFRGAVRHRDRPVRGDPRGDRLQPLLATG